MDLQNSNTGFIDCLYRRVWFPVRHHLCLQGTRRTRSTWRDPGFSNQCMSLVRDNILVRPKMPRGARLFRNLPHKLRARRLFMQWIKLWERDQEAGSAIARGVPAHRRSVHTTPKEPQATFPPFSRSGKTFPKENRLLESSLQGSTVCLVIFTTVPVGSSFDSIADMHVLIYLANLDFIPIRES